MRVKLLDRNLIRCFGGVIVDMTDSQANKYISKGSAILLDNECPKNATKNLNFPVEDKMVWIAPEQKIFEKKEEINLDLNPYPGPHDRLFSQIQ